MISNSKSKAHASRINARVFEAWYIRMFKANKNCLRFKLPLRRCYDIIIRKWRGIPIEFFSDLSFVRPYYWDSWYVGWSLFLGLLLITRCVVLRWLVLQRLYLHSNRLVWRFRLSHTTFSRSIELGVYNLRVWTSPHILSNNDSILELLMRSS